MSNSLGKALTTVFVLGIVVSFSSLLFLVVFFNFSVLPPIPVIVSVLVCAGFQLAAYLGGVVFQKRIWPAILCMLTCSVGTAWAGAVGPGALFGMPGTILANAEKTLSNPLYLASMPVTIVGFGTGIAYFVLGVSSLLHDSHLINRERENASAAEAHKTPDKAAIYSQVTGMLGVTGQLDAPEATPALAEETNDSVEEVAVEEPDAAEDSVSAEVLEAAEAAEQEASEGIPDGDLSEPDDDDGESSEEPVVEDGPPEIDEDAAAPDAEEIASTPVLETPSTSTVSVFSRLTAKIATFFAVEQPEDTPEGEPLEAEREAGADDKEPPSDPPFEEAEETVGEDPADSDPDDEEDTPAPDSVDESPSADAEEPDPTEDTVDADAPADEADAGTNTDTALESFKEQLDGTPDIKEIPPFLAMRRSELLSGWAETPYLPIPPEDVAVSLETDRLRILRLDKKAFSALLQGIEELEAATGLTPSGEQLDSHTLDTFDTLYTHSLEDPQNYKWFAVWVITSKVENKLLGSAGFKGCPDGDGEVELGYGVNETHRGHNYADEAAVALCQWALLQQDVRAVTAETALANVESENLVEKAGLKRVKETSTSCFWRLEKQEGA